MIFMLELQLSASQDQPQAISETMGKYLCELLYC